MDANKKIKSYTHQIIFFKSNKAQHFSFFDIAILFQSAVNCKTKHNILFYNENTWQKRTPANRIESFL